jgi:ribose/xylose/arabinose/galactoside ABC-type transport system permease subunit
MLVLRLVMRVLMLMLVMLVLVLVLMLVFSTSSFGRAARSDGHAHGDAVGVRVSLHVWVDMRMS